MLINVNKLAVDIPPKDMLENIIRYYIDKFYGIKLISIGDIYIKTDICPKQLIYTDWWLKHDVEEKILSRDEKEVEFFISLITLMNTINEFK